MSDPILILSKTSELKTWSEVLWRLIGFIIIFLFIIVVTYITTKLIAKKSITYTNSRNIKLVDRIALGMDKSICVINIGNNYYIIAIGKQNIELIDKINKDEINITSNDSALNSYSYLHKKFDAYLNKYFKNKKEERSVVKATDQIMEKKENYSLQKKLQYLKNRYKDIEKGMNNMNNKDERQ